MPGEQPDESPAAPAARPPWWHYLLRSEDWWAVWIGAALLLLIVATIGWPTEATEAPSSAVKSWLVTPQRWSTNPADAVWLPDGRMIWPGLVKGFALLAAAFAAGSAVMGHGVGRFLPGFVGIYALAVLAFSMAEQELVRYYGLEYALWALLVGLLISNTVGTPALVRPALRTEFYIKTGLVALGAEVLVDRLLALGAPGVFVAWVVTPIVLVGTYLFGQKVLKIESRSLNIVISADMSVCGVSAAIATAAACRAKREELSLAISLSLGFTVIMMVVLPAAIRGLGLNQVLGGAWIGGTIDSTGAVAAAGGMLGDVALQVATTIKMIQNILIGFTAFFVAVYWVTRVEAGAGGARPDIWEIWYRFPKFVLGFLAASLVFSAISASGAEGEGLVKATTDVTRQLRTWCFCLAFVSIGLESNFAALARSLKGGKPLVLYVCGQAFNLTLTLLMAWLMFEVVFADATSRLLSQ